VRLLDADVLADPYPLHRRLREESPVHWDPYLHSWVVTRYDDVVRVLTDFSATRTPTPERLVELGMGQLAPVAAVMVRQMLFLDPPAHHRIRGLAHGAFTPRRIERLRVRIQRVTDDLIDTVCDRGAMDVLADLAEPLPAIITAELLGVPEDDHALLKDWSAAFAEMLGNFQHNPGRVPHVLRNLAEMADYFRAAVRREAVRPTDGLINTLVTARVDGDRLSEDDVIANIVVTMVGGQETTTNLIGNGLLALLRQPSELERLRADPALMPSAIEELLRFESPSQHTARLAPDDVELGGQQIRRGRVDNRHLAFGWAAHFCFGAPLARMEGAIALGTVLRRLPDLAMRPGPLHWRPNLGLRGLTALPVSFAPSAAAGVSRSPGPRGAGR